MKSERDEKQHCDIRHPNVLKCCDDHSFCSKLLPKNSKMFNHFSLTTNKERINSFIDNECSCVRKFEIAWEMNE